MGSPNGYGRAIKALKDSTSQLRNACTFKQAPGLVIIVPKENHFDDHMIAVAAYGKLTVPISIETRELGERYYGRDGMFRPDKNRHISGAVHLRRQGGPATYFPNPFAHHKIEQEASLPRGLDCAEVTFV